MRLRVGSRGSRLALVQARIVCDRLERGGHTTSIVTVETAGDRDRASRFPEFGGGAFTGELEQALLDGADVIVSYSARDALAGGWV